MKTQVNTSVSMKVQLCNIRTSTRVLNTVMKTQVNTAVSMKVQLCNLRTSTRVLNTVIKTQVNTAVSMKVQLCNLRTSTRVLNSHEDPGEHTWSTKVQLCKDRHDQFTQNINQGSEHSHEDRGEHSCEHQQEPCQQDKLWTEHTQAQPCKQEPIPFPSFNLNHPLTWEAACLLKLKATN